MKVNLGLALIWLLAIPAPGKVQDKESPVEARTSDVWRRSLEVLGRDLESGASPDERIQAGLALLPYRPEEASLAIINNLQESRASAQITDSTVDRLSPYLSQPILRHARRAARKTLPPRWALRLLANAADPRGLQAMERYLLVPGADPGMIPLLASYGEKAVGLLEKLLHRSYESSCRAALVLAELGDTAHYAQMEAYGEANLCLAWILAELRPERARPLMLAHLASKNPNDRRKAVYSLGSTEDSFYIPFLYELLSDTDAVLASNAAFALGFFGNTSGASILQSAAADTGSAAGRNSEKLLSHLPPALIAPVLHPLLSADHGTASLRAAKAAGELKDSASVPYLLELLATGTRSVQQASIEALGDIGEASAREHVRPFLDSEEVPLKVAAMLAAGSLADTAVLTRLNLMLFWEPAPGGTQGWIRHPIVDALAMIGDTSALPALALVLDDGDPYLGVKIMRFFAEKASADYIPYVEPLLDSPFYPLRQSAAAAILAMAER